MSTIAFYIKFKYYQIKSNWCATTDAAVSQWVTYLDNRLNAIQLFCFRCGRWFTIHRLYDWLRYICWTLYVPKGDLCPSPERNVVVAYQRIGQNVHWQGNMDCDLWFFWLEITNFFPNWNVIINHELLTDAHTSLIVQCRSIWFEHYQPNGMPQRCRARLQYTHRSGHILSRKHCQCRTKSGRKIGWRRWMDARSIKEGWKRSQSCYQLRLNQSMNTCDFILIN